MIPTWVNFSNPNLVRFLLKAGKHAQISRVGTETFLEDTEGVIVYMWVLAKLPWRLQKLECTKMCTQSTRAKEKVQKSD